MDADGASIHDLCACQPGHRDGYGDCNFPAAFSLLPPHASSFLAAFAKLVPASSNPTPAVSEGIPANSNPIAASS
jgi:hypothetical protein